MMSEISRRAREPTRDIVISVQAEVSEIDISIKKSDPEIAISVESGGAAYHKYTGDYTVEPRLSEDITLDTKGKVMTDDLTVEQIPVYMVSNPAGGITYYIGK